MILRTMTAAILALILCSEAPHAQNAIKVSVEDAYACALYDDAAVWCWGWTPGSSAEPPFIAEKINNLPPTRDISVGALGACAIDDNYALWCWGLGTRRSLREKDEVTSTTPFKVEGLPPVGLVDVGYTHICAVARAEGEVWCWGSNYCGELGCGDKVFRSEPNLVPYLEVRNIVSVSTGVSNTCAVNSSGAVLCWGSDNPTMPGMSFVFESTEPIIFDVNVTGRLLDVTNGRNFACGLRRDGRVTCWGSNLMDQIGTEAPRLSDGAAGLGEVDGLLAAKAIDATYFNACAINEGRVLCWGARHPIFERDSEGPWLQPFFDSATDIAIGELFACAIEAGRVSCWGEEQIIPDMTPEVAVSIPGLPGGVAPSSELLQIFEVRRLIDRQSLEEAAAMANELLDTGNPYTDSLSIVLAESFYNEGRNLFDDDKNSEAVLAFNAAETWVQDRRKQGSTSADDAELLADILYRRGRAYQKLGEYARALEDFGETIALEPENRLAYRRMGDAAEAIGDYELAIHSFERALEIRPDYAAALNEYAWFRLSAGLLEYRDPEHALRLVQKAVAIDQDSSYLDTLGAALVMTGDIEGAIEAYSKALAGDIDYRLRLAEDLIFLGCLRKDGKFALAKELEQALRSCLEKKWLPFDLSYALDRLDRIAEKDPETALAHLDLLQREYPDHPEIVRLEEVAEEWVPE